MGLSQECKGNGVLENSMLSFFMVPVKKEKRHVITWLDAEKAFGKVLNLWEKEKKEKPLEN